MTKYHALPLITKYWKPGEDYLSVITDSLEKRIRERDYVVISEKALSTAQSNVADESSIVPGCNAQLIALLWMRLWWGYFLGIFCHFGPRLLQRLRTYPSHAGSRHKQLALQHAGLLQALMFGSEGGIDGSNLPYSLVSLPLKDVDLIARDIHNHVLLKLNKSVTVVIVDTDKTYSIGNFHFTPRPRPLKGIFSGGGLCMYLAGRFLNLRKRPTPLAVAGEHLTVEEALKISNIADRARGPGSGSTVWDMAARFKVGASDVTWAMLETLRHKPIVLVRKDTV
jgi:F420-0:gamma-glutamyl ligase-like protein